MHFTKFGRAVGGFERDIKNAERYLNAAAKHEPDIQLACISYHSALLEAGISLRYVKTEGQRARYDKAVNRLGQLQKSLVEYGIRMAERKLEEAHRSITDEERRVKEAREVGLPAKPIYTSARTGVLSAEMSITPLLKAPNIGDNDRYTKLLVPIVDRILELRRLLEAKKAVAA
ncbi:MAG: hypothetical protein HY516_02375 [Candidatus Aenigmarchaeota archaeon]|nr:hypothetical protein [Candidatus Aenigmarchaeota archaeon]